MSAEQLTVKRGPAVKQLDEGEPELDKAVVDKYLASLRTAMSSKSEVCLWVGGGVCGGAGLALLG